ncbi:MAG: hypothetical protein OXE02_01415 [Chloroflexi bacterium]|nr:hypothetical protein [Chloroflexota bacterium]
MDGRSQHLISELILLRLLAILEVAIDELACRLVAGATYTNGTQSGVSVPAKSIAAAKHVISSSKRNKKKSFLNWTKASEIEANLCHVFTRTEPIINYAYAHANILDEMKNTRNYVAHNNPRTRRAFQAIMRATYSGNASLSVGAFLTSTKRHQTAKIDEYLTAARVIVGDLSKG